MEIIFFSQFQNRLLALDKENNQTAIHIANSISFTLTQSGNCDNNNMLEEMEDNTQNCSSQENLIDHYPGEFIWWNIFQ